MVKINDLVQSFQINQREYLREEENLAGGYEKWYSDLLSVREYIRKMYVKWDLAGKVFRPRQVVTGTGDVIDHHAISYLAPLNFTRIGWGGKRIEPHEQMKLLADYFESKGKRFIYIALPNKAAVYPQRLVPAGKWGGYSVYHPNGGNMLLN